MIRKFFVFLFFSFFLTGCWELEKGVKVGQIIDIKKAGFLIKTWECKIQRGGIEDGTGTMGASIWLTIEDKDILSFAQHCLEQKRFVSVAYHKELISFLRSESDNYFIDNIKVINTQN